MEHGVCALDHFSQCDGVAHVGHARVHPVAVPRLEPEQVPLDTRPREAVVDDDPVPVLEQPVGEVRADEPGAAGDQRVPAVTPTRFPVVDACEQARLCRVALGKRAGKQLRLAVGVHEAEVVVARVDVEAVARAPRRIEILGGVPVDAPGRSGERVHERAQLRELVVPPGGEAGFGDPDVAVGAGLIERPVHGVELRLPSFPDRRPAAGETVDADDVDPAQPAERRDVAQPVHIRRRHAAEHRDLAAALHPVRGIAHHLGEGRPLRVQPPIPVVEVVRLVPELDLLEATAVLRDENVEKVRVVTQPTRRRRVGRDHGQRGRRVVHARKELEVAGEARQQPAVPFGPAG
jgi:hypothetical protein